MTCSWVAVALPYSLFLLAGRRFARRGRWDRCVVLTVAAFMAIETLGWLGVAPTMHWLAPYPDPGRLRLGLILAGLSILAIQASPEPRFDLSGKTWLLLLPVIEHAIVLAAGRYGMDNNDSDIFMRTSFLIFFRGFDAFIGQWFHWFVFRPFLLEILWWAPFRLMESLWVPLPMAAMLAGRVLAFSFSELALLSVYFMGRELFDKETGFWGAFLLGACVPAFSFYGFFYFKDVPFAAVSCLAILCLFKAVSSGEPAWGALSGVLWFASIGLSWHGVYLGVPLAAVCLVSGGRRSWIPGASCLAAFIGTALVSVLAAVRGSPEDSWRFCRMVFAQWREMSRAYSGHSMQSYIDYDWEPPGFLFYFKHLTGIVGVPICVLMGARFWGDRSVGKPPSARGPAAGRLLLLAVWIGGLILPMSAFRSKDERWLTLTFPAFALLGAQGFIHLKRRAGGRAAACVLTPMVILSTLGFVSLLGTPWMKRDFFVSSEVYRGFGGRHQIYSARLCRAAAARVFSRAGAGSAGGEPTRFAETRARLFEEIDSNDSTPLRDARGLVIPGATWLLAGGRALQPASFGACASRLDQALVGAGVLSVGVRRRAREELSGLLGRPD